MKIIKENNHLMIIKHRDVTSVYLLGVLVLFVGLWLFFFQDLPWQFNLWYFLFLILLGLIALLLMEFNTIAFDKNINKLSIKKLLFLSNRTEQYNLNQVKGIELRYWRINLGKYYELVIVLHNGQAITLSKSSLYPMFYGDIVTTRRKLELQMQKTKEKIVGEKLSQFLNVPLSLKYESIY